MAKIREISSIEHGLAEAIKNLKADLIEKATGKSESFIRKCSDPDLDQQLDHRDAVKIDKACISDIFVESGSNSHYINDDLGNFEINDEVYSKLKLENDIVPLFYARSATQEEWNPVVWARKVSNGKVFFDALGHDAESFNHPKHSEIIIRAKKWIIDREKDY